MRAFFTVLVIFAAAVGLALAAHFNPGNVVVFFPPYRIDLSLNLFLLLAVVAFVFLYGLITLARRTLGLPQRVAEYRRRQRELRANRALRHAFVAYVEGRFGHAEKLAQQASDWPDNVGLAALIGARAAHGMSEYARRDEWLRSIADNEAYKAARLMTEADCLVDQREVRRALEAVQQLHGAGARHIQSLRLALKAHRYAGDWPEVLRLVRILAKRDALHPIAARQIKTQAYEALLSRRTDAHALGALWQEVPPAERIIPEIALVGARAFNAAGLGYQARLIVESALSAQWDQRLLLEYLQCIDDANVVQIERVERWVTEHPDDLTLRYVLGVLCARAKLWGKAQQHLADVAAHGEPQLVRQAQRELGLVFEAIGDPEKAAAQFRAAALV